MIKIALLALEGCPLSALALPVDILHAAGVLYNRMAGIPEDPRFRVRIVSLEDRPVRCYKSVHNNPGWRPGRARRERDRHHRCVDGYGRSSPQVSGGDRKTGIVA